MDRKMDSMMSKNANSYLVDRAIREMSSDRLEYLASRARCREAASEIAEQEKELMKEYKGKRIPVLSNTSYGAKCFATKFSNVTRDHDCIYMDGNGTFYVLHRNEGCGTTFVAKVVLDYNADTVTVFPSTENTKPCLDGLIETVSKSNDSYVIWKLTNGKTFHDDGFIKYQVNWRDRKTAIREIVADDNRMRPIRERLINDIFG